MACSTIRLSWAACAAATLFMCVACDVDTEEGRDCSLATGYVCAEGYACVQGRCTETLREGKGCTLAGPETGAIPCAEGLVCSAEGDGFVCRPPASGGTACLQDAECETGLVCRRRNTTSDTSCFVPAAYGAFCDATSDCEGALVCRVNAVDATRACSVLGERGEVCSANEDCAAGLLCSGGLCD